MMIFRTAVVSALVATAHAASITGYVVDNRCMSICENSPADTPCTPDSVNTWYEPEAHTGWCLLLPACVNSGFLVMSETPLNGRREVILDLGGSQDNVVSYIEAGTDGSFPKVIVEYDEVLATDDSPFGVPNAVNATLRDTWTDDYYTGDATYQVTCSDVDSASIADNNLCFRSDVIVTETADSYKIESNGCPDHAVFQGSRGAIPNSQEAEGSCSATCGGTSCGCGSQGCGCGCGCGSQGCGCGCGCGSQGSCGSNSTCGCGSQGGCGSNSTCGCGSEGCGTGCGACGCGCGACGCGCGACGCGCGACGCGCGACGTGTCDGCTTKGPYDPMFQHYTMVIPKNAGTPGDAKPIEDDAVGILTNGVLLDSHKQTWAYDNCNGHSDKKGQYHYHIPPKCFVESFEWLVFADTEAWWINDDATEVRAYEEMSEQFPSQGTPSPVIGFARDGFPIYALYDDNGDLQRGKDYGGSVDECNGKVDKNGNYGYFITVDPPFAPPCLKGNVGVFSYYSTKIACPADGIENKVFSESDAAKCLVQAEDSSSSAQSGTTPFESVKGCDLSREVDSDSGVRRAIAAVGIAVMVGHFIHQLA